MRLSTLLLITLLVAGCLRYDSQPSTKAISGSAPITPLPKPQTTGSMSLEEALQNRRSTRDFSTQGVDIQAISQLLWAAQGITHERGFRTAPSAGALYPLEIYLLTLDAVYHYVPDNHALEMIHSGDFRAQLHNAALRQDPVRDAPVVFVITAVYERTQGKYGAERSPRYVHLEAGHAAQNLLLQAVAIGLGAVPIGAFHDRAVQEVLGLPEDHEPMYIIPVGHPK